MLSNPAPIASSKICEAQTMYFHFDVVRSLWEQMNTGVCILGSINVTYSDPSSSESHPCPPTSFNPIEIKPITILKHINLSRSVDNQTTWLNSFSNAGNIKNTCPITMTPISLTAAINHEYCCIIWSKMSMKLGARGLILMTKIYRSMKKHSWRVARGERNYF